MSSAPQHSPRLNPPGEPALAHLDLVPVDPHRLFAHWNLPPRDLGRLRDMAGHHAAGDYLTLRIFRLPDGGAGLREAVAVQDFPVGASSSDGYFSLAKPGGNVVGVLGMKNAENRFTPALTSGRVALPEAPRSGVMAVTPETIEPPAAPEAPPPPAPEAAGLSSKTKGAPAPPLILDEEAVVKAAGRMTTLPEQLRTVPATVPPDAEPTPLNEERALQKVAPPDTPALNERNVVTSALRRMLADAVESNLPAAPADELRPAPGAGAQPEPAPAGSDSSIRLASQFSAVVSGAPMRMRATLVVAGRLAPGQRLRVGNQQITADPGGRISFRHQIESTEAVWPLLLQVVLQQPARSVPSLELLSDLPDSEALLSLHASIDIEGEIQDPAYRSRLPREVKVDEAGRFRLVRSLPAGALLLPHLVLVSSGERQGSQRP